MKMSGTRCFGLIASLLVSCGVIACGDLFGPNRGDRLWISATALHLTVGDTSRLGVTMERDGQLEQRPQWAAPSALPDRIAVEFWSSSPEIADVDATGLVSARAQGAAIVWVRVESHVDSATVVVAEAGSTQGPAFASISAGGAHSCGVTTAGEIRCWGTSWHGEIGIGTMREFTATVSPVPIHGTDLRHVTAGSRHTCALDREGFAWCWGDNPIGQRGNGGRENRAAPARVASDIRFAAISAGAFLTCALTPAGEPYCWGEIARGVRSGTPRRLDTTLRFVEISTGGFHACGLTDAGDAYCWGQIAAGHPGGAPMPAGAEPVHVEGGHAFSVIDAGTGHTCAIDLEGAAYCWGDGSFGQLGTGAILDHPVSAIPLLVTGGHQWSRLSAGGVHTCGITTANVAYCWGQDRHGQLGRGLDSYDGLTSGDLIERDPVPVVGELAFRAIDVGFGDHTCGITVDDRAYCWGFNRSGQLGIGKQEFFAGTLLQMRTEPIAVRGGGG